MATTSVNDAVVIAQDPGTGLSSLDDPISAAGAALLASHTQGEYVKANYGNNMGFANHDGANNTVDIQNGACFIRDTSSSTANQRGSGGNPQIQSEDDGSIPPTYDTELPEGSIYLVIFPASTTISVGDTQLNEVYVDLDVTSNNSVDLVHDDGGGVSAPSETFLKLGETNPDDASADIRSNDNPSLTTASLDTEVLANSIIVKTGDDLQAKVNTADAEGKNVFLSGQITGLTSPVSIPTALDVFGHGYIRGGIGPKGSYIEGDVSGPLLQLDNDASIDGIAVENTNSSGDGVSVEGFCEVLNCHITGQSGGIVEPSSPDVTPEPKVKDSVIQSNSGSGTGSVGIDFTTLSDAKIFGNVVKGWATNIRVTKNGFQFSGNHSYIGLPNANDKALVLEGSGVVSNNRFGVGSTVGVEITAANELKFTENEVYANGGDGIHFNLPSSDDIKRSQIKNNTIIQEGSGGTAISTTNVSGTFRSVLRDNDRNGFGSDGLKLENNGTSTQSGDGSTTTFTIAHGLINSPDAELNVTPQTADSAGDLYVTSDGTDIIINYTSAPASGTDNLVWKWSARAFDRFA